MKIGIDVDNVCCNTTEVLLRVYNHDAHDNLQMSDMTDYKIDSFVKPHYKEKIPEYFYGNRVWKQIECIKDSQKYVQTLHDDGHELYIVTATHGADLFGKWKWLKRNYPCIKTDNIIRLVNKQMPDLDYLIDDFQGNFIDCKYSGIMMAYPWNVDFKQNNVQKGV